MSTTLVELDAGACQFRYLRQNGDIPGIRFWTCAAAASILIGAIAGLARGHGDVSADISVPGASVNMTVKSTANDSEPAPHGLAPKIDLSEPETVTARTVYLSSGDLIQVGGHVIRRRRP